MRGRKNGRPFDVLLVEDNPGDARLAHEAFSESRVGIRLHTVEDGAQALAFLHRRGSFSGAPRPDLLLLDLNLPGTDGRELLAEIKQDSKLKSIPVVVLTTSQAEEDISRCYELQANCYIVKPHDWEQFSKVANLIATFWLSLARLPTFRQPDAPGTLKVLLVEDEPGDAGLVKEMLADEGKSGFYLIHAATLGEALGRFNEESFDVVLLDLSLPDSQGLETLSRVLGQGTGVPVLVLTGLDDEALAIRAVQQGAQDYLVKGRFDGRQLARASRHAIERMRSGREVQHQAHHDSLTGLPNRRLMQDRLAQALEKARRYKRMLAVLYLDLDQFKAVNDSLGHAAGDQLLQMVAQRLKGCIRASDTVARVGGDEFTLALLDVKRVEDVMTVIDKVFAALRPPARLGDREVSVPLSIGACIYPEDGETAEMLLENADSAMYRAKQEGGSGYRFFSPATRARAFEREVMVKDLRHAVEQRELLLHYQPTLDLVSGRIVGAEALVRWLHRSCGMLYPAGFIPLAEESGLILEIGEWVLRNACLQCRTWQEGGFPSFRIGVNLSSRQLGQKRGLLETVTRVLHETGIEPSHLELDVTEGSILQDEAGAIETLRELSALRIWVSVDDFGTGHSRLHGLKDLPVTALKIDRTLIRDVMRNPQDEAVVKAIIEMAHGLRLKVTAEGVDSQDQIRRLQELGCNQAQGHYLGPPVPAEEFTRSLRDAAA